MTDPARSYLKVAGALRLLLGVARGLGGLVLLLRGPGAPHVGS